MRLEKFALSGLFIFTHLLACCARGPPTRLHERMNVTSAVKSFNGAAGSALPAQQIGSRSGGGE
jgi:hypothetical protein